MEIITKSPEETFDLGKKIGTDLKSNPYIQGAEWIPLGWHRKEDRALVMTLTGDLGTGKTTFLQGLAEGIGIKQGIISPTYILMRKYNIVLDSHPNYDVRSGKPLLKYFYHMDLYRLEGDVNQQLLELGYEEFVNDPENLIAVEWAEKASGVYPDDLLWLKFEDVGDDQRKIIFRR
ncbi:tRNA (adenosine(37)-N6)-threonylcarbamoyltransferase complex ATPase subunit type 1 TsaE [Candidatus Woesebacteria bacterium]|nr:tRNA (adenosine(37)-N6)-threonylcarbamoyltransferase complex ATPase subunit type 1 TsaE [Candidatus Woesebacteria bacterium]